MESMSPKVSVIMPAYNTAGLIAKSLDSVLQQTFQDFEIIVVNDGSPDTPQLEQALAPYLQKIVYIKQENKRAAGARNTAIGRARGEFLAFLDSDDLWLPDHLAGQMKLFEADPSLGLVYCDCFMYSDPARSERFMQQCPSEGEATFETLITEQCQIPVSTVVARKTAIVEAGLFDQGLARCDDYDMWLRTAFHGAKIAYSRQVQVRVNEGRPGSLGVSNARMVEAQWIILEKTRKTLPLSDAERKLVDGKTAEIRARYVVEEGKVALREGRFGDAKTMLREANASFPRLKLGLILLGLNTAPHLTRKVVDFGLRKRAQRRRRD